jgi:hypothetical protein
MGKRIDINAEILRDPPKEKLELACAVRVKPNGKYEVVHYVPEYGDQDGSDHIDEFIREASCSLRKGERLIRRNLAIPVEMALTGNFKLE